MFLHSVLKKNKGLRSARWQLLASLGYVVSVLDNRGSAGRGMAFQAELYHKMGTVEIEDQVKHVRYLVEQGWVDPARVAIYGSSYGGYMTLMALCKHADVFKIGYAYAPVTSWEAYDTGFVFVVTVALCFVCLILRTGTLSGTWACPLRILAGIAQQGICVVCPLCFAAQLFSSVLENAEGFPSELDRVLIFHGGSDENVHFAHTGMLCQRLADLNKFYSLNLYPNSRHGVSGLQSALAMIAHIQKHL